MINNKTERIQVISSALRDLTNFQLQLVEEIVDELRKPYKNIERLLRSDIISECILQNFGDVLRIHHAFSREPFTKDKFEYALERVSNLCGTKAELAPRGHPGHDITINRVRVSLKTQADKSISINRLYISKFMELGKGTWSDSVEQLEGLREQFLNHLIAYDRIFSLRCLSRQSPTDWHYELVEIPKGLLQRAQNGVLTMKVESRQNPKPGYCNIISDDGELMFQLYFDGGTERKLQIRHLQKKHCTVHAEWIFAKRETPL